MGSSPTVREGANIRWNAFPNGRATAPGLTRPLTQAVLTRRVNYV